MKKTILLLLLLLTAFSVFGLFDPYSVQKISGYIDDMTYLYVSPYQYESTTYGQFYGIDLDYNDASNGFRYQIKPSSDNEPGLQIGTFTLLATFVNSSKTANLKVTHEKLIHSNGNDKLEYELAILYTISDGTSISNPDPKIGTSTQTITVPISSSIASVLDGNIYFRLKEAPTVEGQYTSRVRFYLEVN